MFQTVRVSSSSFEVAQDLVQRAIAPDQPTARIHVGDTHRRQFHGTRVTGFAVAQQPFQRPPLRDVEQCSNDGGGRPSSLTRTSTDC